MKLTLEDVFQLELTSKELHVYLCEVTPEAARMMLLFNTHNRAVRPAHVRRLARQMTDGRFLVNGDVVAYDWDGVLLDGQHRLEAVLKAGVAVTMIILTGLDPKAQETMDQSTKRTGPDVLRLRDVDVPQASRYAAVARNELLMAGIEEPTPQELADEVEDQFHDIAEAVHVQRRCVQAGLRGGAIYGTAWLYLARVDRAAADSFFDTLVTGAGLADNDPRLILRDALLRRGRELVNSGRDLSRLYQALHVFVKVWNAWRQGRTHGKVFRPTNTNRPFAV
jgi:uncharacterized protein YciI